MKKKEDPEQDTGGMQIINPPVDDITLLHCLVT